MHAAAVVSSSLAVELAEQRDAAFDPMLLRLVARQRHRDDEVGRVPRRRQHAAPFARLVDGRDVDRLVGDVRPLARLQPDCRQDVVEHLRDGLVQLVRVAVPARAVDEQSVDVGAVVGRLDVGLSTQRDRESNSAANPGFSNGGWGRLSNDRRRG